MASHRFLNNRLRRGTGLMLEANNPRAYQVDNVEDCPLTYSASALHRTMPKALRNVNQLPRRPKRAAPLAPAPLDSAGGGAPGGIQ